MLEATVFALLLVLLLYEAGTRSQLLAKTRFEWLLDGSNLLIQGLLIPFLRISVIFVLCEAFWPAGRGLWQLSWLAGLLLNLVAVDYLYYWNHRLFHHKKIFPVHLVHHSVTQMDVMATSRNTLWTSFLIVYLWVNGFLLYLTDLNAGYLLGMSLSAALDLWKHSSALRQRPGLQVWLSKYLLLMTPLDHAWHHAQKLNQNFGANFNLFDKLHGTFSAESTYPERLGVKTRLSPWRQLLYPFQP